MDGLPIYTLIHNRYLVLDHSGNLPFSIVFGLCRRSSNDTDSRPLILDTRKSALDVPYALANNLLKLNVEDADLKQETAAAVSQLTQFGGNATFLTLPSPVDRKANWKSAIVTYQYQIHPDSQLAAVFRPGKKYQFHFTGNDLAVKWYGYGDGNRLFNDAGEPILETEKPSLLSSPTHGKCSFKVLRSLPWPPTLRTKLELAQAEPSQNNSSSRTCLRISVTNTGSRPVSVQTSGTQRFLAPWGPMQPEERTENMPRLIDSRKAGPNANLRVIEQVTGAVVRGPVGPGPCSPPPPRDPRPMLDRMVTIYPETPLVKLVDVSKLLEELSDGIFEIRMESRGMWWCEGSCDEFVKEGDARVPHRVWRSTIPPAMLESKEGVKLHVASGVASW